MAETEMSRFRLSPAILTALDALAASNGGNRSHGVRETIAYWHRAVTEAARQNAEELSSEDWIRLGHLNDPDPMTGLDLDEDTLAVDWSARLTHELIGMWEGRSTTLPMHRDEANACRELAGRIGGWGIVRGYALFACLRWFWRPNQKTPAKWWEPENWMKPVEKRS